MVKKLFLNGRFMQTNPTIDMNGRQWTRTGQTFAFLTFLRRIQNETGGWWGMSCGRGFKIQFNRKSTIYRWFSIKTSIEISQPATFACDPRDSNSTPPWCPSTGLWFQVLQEVQLGMNWSGSKRWFFFCPKFGWLAVILMPVPGSLSLTHGHSHRFPLVPTKIYSPPRVPRGRMCWQKGRDHHHLISQWWRQWWHVGILAWELD
jgi:hypothetical protein